MVKAMKKTQKKIVAVLLCALMILGCGTSSFAEEAPDSTVVTETAPDSTTATQEQKAADDAGLTEEAADVTGTEDPAGDTEETDLPDGVETQDESLSSEEQTAAEGTITVDRTFFCEDENISAEVHVSGTVDLTGLTDVSEEQIEMKAIPQSEEQPEYEAAKAYAEENSADEAEIDVTVLDLEFTCGGQPVDVSACEITAEITPSEKLQEEAETLEVSDEIADEAEIGIQLMALTANAAGETEEADSVTVEKGAEDVPKMAVALNAAEPQLQIVTRSSLNPKFTVQYYANLTTLVRDKNGYLRILDTSRNGDGTGGNLPTNGGSLPQTGLYVEDDGSLKSTTTLMQLYKEKSFKYFDAPGLPYVNIFRDNGNYTAKEVWVLKDGKSASSTNPDDWETYGPIGQATELHFTNNPDKKDDPATIYIEDGMVIRLVADQTESNYNNAATFYDYDITNNGKNTWDGTNGAYGINSNSNYQGTGAKLAFGNANTGTGLDNQTWNGNTLNKYNNASIEGCTFGLVKGLDDQGHIVYADDISAPKLFDDGSAIGKREITNYSLDFNRAGDTYTLSAVSGAGLDNLENFTRLDRYVNGEMFWQNRVIYTNNFWPMDGNQGTDGLTGEYYNRGSFVGYGGNDMYPPSDDSKAHNNLFGMVYSVNFKLTEDYVGPLEYYFFGDDDMWVFLDGRLICDIGGVHSSVGAYVNLWDYIKKGDAGEHTLKFYYTERGLSGSTCYMQFTLPSVSSNTPSYQNSQLKVQKEVVGSADSNTEFSFDISIEHENEVVEGSDYSIVRYDAEGNRVESSLLTGGKGSFKLKANEYVIIDYLQHGTKYTIKETGAEGFEVSNQIDSGTINKSETVVGTIPQGKGSIVLFTNTARPKLPNTGGTGTTLFVFGGMFLMGLAYAGIVYRKRRGMY
ncbi:MAG TPA: fibro-slime domain-containing protein [Candidatus Mediterraneibacter guildfordensis]|nr:fibro-slime domain-containing protein [Candidatus Mediterraneibacter guildfordensis]